MTESEFRAYVRGECERAGGQSPWAEAHGFAASYVSAVINGKSQPSPRFLNALGMERIVTYRAREAA